MAGLQSRKALCGGERDELHRVSVAEDGRGDDSAVVGIDPEDAAVWLGLREDHPGAGDATEEPASRLHCLEEVSIAPVVDGVGGRRRGLLGLGCRRGSGLRLSSELSSYGVLRVGFSAGRQGKGGGQQGSEQPRHCQAHGRTGLRSVPLLFAALTGRSGHGLASSASRGTGRSAPARSSAPRRLPLRGRSTPACARTRCARPSCRRCGPSRQDWWCWAGPRAP